MNEQIKVLLTLLIVLALCFTILNQYTGWRNKQILMKNPCAVCEETYQPNMPKVGLYYNIDNASEIYYKEDNSTEFVPVNYSII